MAASELKHLLPYLQRAAELQTREPKVAYYCRLYALERGMQIPNRNAEIKSFLTSVLNQLEKDKKAIQLSDEDAMYLEGFALDVFQKADKIDRAGRADKNTAIIFYAASLFFEILRQFGDLTPEIESKQKYAVWKAADIRRALDKGLTPQPGPPIKEYEKAEEDEEEVSGATVSSSTVTHASLPSAPAIERPPTPLPESMTAGQAHPLTPQPPMASTDGAPSGEYYGGGQHHPMPPAAPAQFVRSSSFAFSQPENPHFGMPPSASPHPPASQQPSPYSSYPGAEGAAAPTAAGERPYVPSYNAARGSFSSSQPSAPTAGVPTQGGYPGVAGVAAQRGATGSHGVEGGGHVQGWTGQAVPGAGARTVGASAGPAGPGHATNGPFPVVHRTPSPDKVAEAHKAARFAVSALAFDDVPTAVTYLQRSLQLLTNPSTPI